MRGRPHNPLGLGLLTRTATELPIVEGAGCFETIYFDERSWTIARPAECSASVDNIAPLASGGHLVTLQPPETVGPAIYPYVLRPDGTVDALPAVDPSGTGFDTQPGPDGLTILVIEGTVATVQHTPPVPSDHVCLDRILPPPRLVGGADPGEYNVDQMDDHGNPIRITWGDDESAVTQVLQPTFFEEGPSELMSIVPEDDDQFRRALAHEAAVIPVGDPGVGAISIYLRERGTDCIRIYTVGPGVSLDEAIFFAQVFVNDLSQSG